MFEQLYDKITNPVLIENLSEVSLGFIAAFLLALFLAPLSDRLAHVIGAVDLPKNMRGADDVTANRRIHEGIQTRLGGLASAFAIVIAVVVLGYMDFIPRGVAVGFIIVVGIGLLDSIYDLDSRLQLLGQAIAAFILVFAGNTILQVDVGFFLIDLNWYSDLIFEVAGYSYNFIFPADIITIIWIVGMINAINWVGGIDGLNGSISSLAGLTFLLIVLDRANPDIALAALIAIYLGAILGVLPFNWYPQKMMYGSIGDYLNGYLLAVFAIFSSTRWVATIIILGLPLLDALLVIATRFRDHPEVRKNPLKILSVSDKNHLHHRLLASGYSKKMVVLIEIAMMFVLCTIAFWFSGIEREYFAMFAAITLIIIAFTVIAFLRKRNQRETTIRLLTEDTSPVIQKEAVVNIITDQEEKKGKEDEDYERFIY